MAAVHHGKLIIHPLISIPSAAVGPRTDGEGAASLQTRQRSVNVGPLCGSLSGAGTVGCVITGGRECALSRLAGLRASPPPAPPRAPSPRSHPRSLLACPSFDLAVESGIPGGEGGTRRSHSPLGAVTRASGPPRCSWCHGAAGRAAREAGGQGLVDWGGSLPPTAGYVRCPKPLGRPVCPGSLSPAQRLPVTARREQTRAQARRLSPTVTDTQRFSRAHVSRAIGGGGEYGDLSSHTLGGC